MSAAAPAEARRLSRHQVMGLALQFLLGMAVNLVGLPSETTGTAHAITIAFLAAHLVLSAGLLVGAVMIIRAATRARDRSQGMAVWGAVAIVVTVAAGILTLATKSNWWSYAMAVGFIASLLTYGGILLRTDAPPPPRSAASDN